jgi:hypothetical protein
LLRWTIGGVSQQGLHIFKQSLVKTIAALGTEFFDYMICYNNINFNDLEFAKCIYDKILFHEQNWQDCPIPHREVSIKKNGVIEKDTNIFGGSLWKLCPPRIRQETHEIILDNDLIINKRFQELDRFLSSTRTLLLSENIPFFGRYDSCFTANEAYNSGLIGLPPGYDFSSDLLETWRMLGEFPDLSYSDEQGLVCFVLKNTDPIVIASNKIVEIHQQGQRNIHNGVEVHKVYDFNNKESGIHFVEANRNAHKPWKYYKYKNCFYAS